MKDRWEISKFILEPSITDTHRTEFILQIDFWQIWNRRGHLDTLCLEIHREFSFAKCTSRVSRLPRIEEKPRELSIRAEAFAWAIPLSEFFEQGEARRFRFRTFDYRH